MYQFTVKLKRLDNIHLSLVMTRSQNYKKKSDDNDCHWNRSSCLCNAPLSVDSPRLMAALPTTATTLPNLGLYAFVLVSTLSTSHTPTFWQRMKRQPRDGAGTCAASPTTTKLTMSVLPHSYENSKLQLRS